MSIRRSLANWLPWLVIIGLVVGFHFWGKHQRYREWWWISGDQKGMLYLDLSGAAEGKGHVLSTDGDTGDEFKIQWNCRDKSVRWGAMWTRDSDFNQLERRPVPSDLARWHAAKDRNERRVLEIACAKPELRFVLRSVRTERQPIRATHEAREAVRKGVQPHEALFRALGVS